MLYKCCVSALLTSNQYQHCWLPALLAGSIVGQQSMPELMAASTADKQSMLLYFHACRVIKIQHFICHFLQ